MSNLETLVREANQKLDFDAGSLEALRASVERRVRHRRRMRVAAPLACLTLMLGAALGLRRSAESPTATQSPPNRVTGAATGSSLLSLRDGSRVEPASARTRVQVLTDEPQLVRLVLTEGTASFYVVPDQQRRFIVAVRDLEVEVVGTTFVIICRENATEIQVRAGSVRVHNDTGEVRLSGGEARSFAVGTKLSAAFLPTPSLSVSAPTNSRGVEASPSGVGDWRSLAHAGKFAQAFTLMSAAATQPSAGSVEELLLRSDVARLSGHPALAIDSLQAIVVHYPGDSRTPSASFTLGSVYEQLGRPAQAAAAFEKSRALQPGGPLAEDALAREALALLAAGDRPQALSHARQYLDRYPAGVHATQVRQRLGLP